MNVLRAELSKHRSTRSFISKPKVATDSLCDSELKDNLLWQCKVADSLGTYLDAIVQSFTALAEAQQSFNAVGFADEDEMASISQSLVDGISEAHMFVCKSVSETQNILRTQVKALDLCNQDVAKADAAAEELSRYSAKIVVLADEEHTRQDQGKVQPATQARLARNRDKLQQAANAASITHSRAQESLRERVDKKDALCDLVRDAFVTAAQALDYSLKPAGSLQLSSTAPTRQVPPPTISSFAISPKRRGLPTQALPTAPRSPPTETTNGSSRGDVTSISGDVRSRSDSTPCTINSGSASGTLRTNGFDSPVTENADCAQSTAFNPFDEDVAGPAVSDPLSRFSPHASAGASTNSQEQHCTEELPVRLLRDRGIPHTGTPLQPHSWSANALGDSASVTYSSNSNPFNPFEEDVGDN